MAVRTLIDLRVFHHIAAKGAVTSDELAETTGADQILLGMRSLLESGPMR